MASKLILIIVFVLDVIAFGLAVAAEQRRSTVSFSFSVSLFLLLYCRFLLFFLLLICPFGAFFLSGSVWFLRFCLWVVLGLLKLVLELWEFVDGWNLAFLSLICRFLLRISSFIVDNVVSGSSIRVEKLLI